MNPDQQANYEDIIQRLMNENKQYLELINQIKLILNNENEFNGLSMIGGLNSLMSKYLDAKDKNFILEQKIKKLEK